MYTIQIYHKVNLLQILSKIKIISTMIVISLPLFYFFLYLIYKIKKTPLIGERDVLTINITIVNWL